MSLILTSLARYLHEFPAMDCRLEAFVCIVSLLCSERRPPTEGGDDGNMPEILGLTRDDPIGDAGDR